MRILIRNLNAHASENMLHNLFLKFGRVLNVKICTEFSGKPLGYGFIEMKEEIDGRRAINELDRMNFMNQFLDIYEINNNKLI